VRCVKTAELIEMPFGELNYVGPRNHVFGGGRLLSIFVLRILKVPEFYTF